MFGPDPEVNGISKIGIMQGRLVPPEPDRFQAFPRTAWRLEFENAAQAGLQYIEWIFDAYGEMVNPLRSDPTLPELQAASAQSGVEVRALCVDYFMDFPLIRCSPEELQARESVLAALLTRSAQCGIERVVLPFVDNSRITSEAEKKQVHGVLERALPLAMSSGVAIHLETDLGPGEFADFLDRIEHASIRVNYDTGNSSSLGFRPLDEFQAYGARIGSVHIKDRLLGAGTVPLGTGNADFRTVFRCLHEIDYQGDFTLQVARSTPGQEIEWARGNARFVREQLSKWR